MSRFRIIAALVATTCLGLALVADQPGTPPSGPLSPKEELATFRVPKGFRVELVASEPEVIDPVAMAFDESSRLFVAEMRGYSVQASTRMYGLMHVGVVFGAFFGGWLGPVLPGVIWFLIKTFVFISFFVLLRAALPRPRFDQLMSFGWKILLPLATLNLLVTAIVVAS